MKIDSRRALPMHSAMHTRTLLFYLTFAAGLLHAQTPEIAVKAVADHADALYKSGENVTFNIEVSENKKQMAYGKVTCVFS